MNLQGDANVKYHRSKIYQKFSAWDMKWEERRWIHDLESEDRRGVGSWELQGFLPWKLIDAVSQVERQHIQLNSQIWRSAAVPRSNWWLAAPNTADRSRRVRTVKREAAWEVWWSPFWNSEGESACLTRDWLGSRRLCCDGDRESREERDMLRSLRKGLKEVSLLCRWQRVMER